MSILIVDDEQIILQTLSAIFKREGFAVKTEENPVTAVELYEKGNYNIVLVDVLMPEMKGVEVIRKIKEMNPLCNIIVMTAFSNMISVVECIEAGAVDYITKPFTDLDILLSVVKTTMERVERWAKSFGVQLSD